MLNTVPEVLICTWVRAECRALIWTAFRSHPCTTISPPGLSISSRVPGVTVMVVSLCCGAATAREPSSNVRNIMTSSGFGGHGLGRGPQQGQLPPLIGGDAGLEIGIVGIT